MIADRDPFFGPLPQKILENLDVLEDRYGEIYDAYLAKHDEESRVEAEFSLRSFLRQAWPHLETSPFVGGWHVDAICDHFQAVSLGHIQRLLVTVPPRTTKSISGNICWNAWEWIADPTLRYLFVSYGQFLSHFNAQRCRRLIKTPWYQMRWGDRYELRSDQDAKGYFETEKGGYRISTSVDGFGTGLGGERVFADDPHSVDEAESDLERERTIRAWTDTMATRGNDPRRARWVVVMQRVHPQDLAASCIEMGDYVQLCLPAEYEAHRKCRVFLRNCDGDEYLFFEDPREREGESIEPVRLPKDYLARMRRSQREKYFAQFQQRPAPPESAMFSRDDFPAVALHHVPDDVDWVRYWDFAATKRERGKKPDYTVGSLIGKSRSTGRKYVRDIRRVQMRPAQVKRLVLATAERDGRLVPVRWGRDPGSAGVWVADDLATALHRFDAKGDIETGDKRHRAEPVSTQSEAGLWAFARARWNDAAWAELEGFPEGDNDDIVDTFSGAAKYLDEGGKAMPQWTIDHHLATADEAITAFGDASRGHAGAFVPGTRWNLARAIQYDDRSRRDGYALWIGTPPLGDRAATHLFLIRGLALRPNLSPHEVLAEVNRTEREIVGPIRPDRPEVVFTILPPYAARLRDVLSLEHGIDCALSDADARAGLAALRDALRVDGARLHPIFVGEDGLPLRGAPRLIAIVRSESGLREPKDESDLLRLRQAVEHYTTDGRDRSRTRVAEDYPALQALLALAATWFVEGQEKTERELIEERLPEGLRAGRMPSEADPEAWMRARHLYLAEAEGEAAVDADEDAFFGRRKRIS